MERASIHQLYPEPDKSLAELETRSDVNFYRILRAHKDAILSLDDDQIGRVMRMLIANDGTVYLESDAENEVYIGLLVEAIFEIV